jgi:hypothetical protein
MNTDSQTMLFRSALFAASAVKFLRLRLRPARPLCGGVKRFPAMQTGGFESFLSVFICTTIHMNLRSLRKFSLPYVTFVTHLTHSTLWLRLCRAGSICG